jgi:transcription elongation GreA/GreB family factor
MTKEKIREKIIAKLSKEIEDLEDNQKNISNSGDVGKSREKNAKFEQRVAEERILAILNERKSFLDEAKTVLIPDNLENIQIGACATISDDGVDKKYIIFSLGAGVEVWDDDTLDSYTVAVPESALGRSIIGKKKGERCSLRIGQKTKNLLVKEVW